MNYGPLCSLLSSTIQPYRSIPSTQPKMTKPTIISLYPIEKSISNFSTLHENFNIVHYTLSTPENFINDMQKEPYIQATAIYGSYPGFKPFDGLMDHTLIDALPPKLKIIGLCSAGYDGYDLQYLRSKGINLCNVPVNDGIAMDVADCALWHVLSGVRKFNSWDKASRITTNGDNDNDSNTLKIRDVVRNDGVIDMNKESGFAFGHMFHGNPIKSARGLKCVVLGYGLIGKAVVDRMLVLGMNVHVIVRDKSKYTANGDVHDVNFHSSLDESQFQNAMKGADVIIVCLPGGKHTLNCINKSTFNIINDNSIIINIGRGSCINTKDLQSAIDDGKVSHAGLDVFPNEPTIENYWLDESLVNNKSNNFFTTSITPHLGSSTLNVYQYASYTCIENIINGLQNNDFINVVN